ncbi:flavin-containing monooxygenase [Actinomadura rayongensis]|uniref:NAD(P)-binding domain-containing protein n=1 Tax=Actinomadura rayongensis TaxID=1429076 RepID=A0A6I4W9A9_9ACTN|nr:NAD(P)/FAD-dependent oxidoreductase [Actinomadura rayongensis]MXQ66171.1 NAD(P)-binding domain-containing protein [Actinomadura rayongensis]
MDGPHEVVIIGAGFGGVGMAITLKRAGVEDVVVLERAESLGGTWRDNTYPGAACDVPSHLYSFSFAPKTDWSRRFPPQREILGYLEDTARKHGVLSHIRFGADVRGARFDEHAAVWRVDTSAGEVAARVLVSACGQLNRPVVPAIEGSAEFQGTAFHSARWDHRADLRGKRVAVIGTGASAVQIVPSLAGRVARLDLYQRTPPYVITKADRAYRLWERTLLGAFPGVHTLSRAKTYAQYEARALGFVVNPKLMGFMRGRFLRRLAEQVPDAELRRKLVPDYPMGCKRVLISDDYYPALTRPDVDLVTDPIARVTEHGVVTEDGTERPADVIIYATGFAATDFLAPMRIEGRDGRELSEEWRHGAQAHLGITVAGFPNLFLLYGPYTNLGHNSIIYMLESQFRYVSACVRAMRRHGLASIEVRPRVQERFVRAMRKRLSGSVWESGCTSWYQTADGTVVNNWPGFTFAYRRATRRPDPRHFRVRRAA